MTAAGNEATAREGACAAGFWRWLLLGVVFAMPACSAPEDAHDERDWKTMRSQMLEEIKDDYRRSAGWTGLRSPSAEVLAALDAVPRHAFVPADVRDAAYRNHPLPIGRGQTISQPFIVALMTDLLEIDSEARVLELGTGSGYQAAVLGELVQSVHTVEIVAVLAEQARERLATLGYDNVHVRAGDGVMGWPEHAPYDGVIVTAAGIEIPQALIDQLKPGGRLVMPVGAQHETQDLIVMTRGEDGSLTRRSTIPVRFVPITGDNMPRR